MRGLLKFLLLVAVLLVIIVGVPLYGLYYLFYVGDQIEVHAAERFGERVCVSIPGAVLSTAIRIAEPGVIIHGEDARQIEAWKPAVSALLMEIEKYPDMTILEAEDGDDHVRIEKKNGKLTIHATSHGDEVKIDIPQDIVDDAVRGLTDL